MHYSTHHYLAEIGLDLYLKTAKRISNDSFWTDDRRTIYLYASCGPDLSDAERAYFIHLKVPSLNLIISEEPKDISRPWHQLRFDNFGKPLTTIQWVELGTKQIYVGNKATSQTYNCASRAQFWQIEAEKFLEGAKRLKGDMEELLDAAAFCLGMMSHYVADCASFQHLIDPYDVDNVENLSAIELLDLFEPFIDIHNDFEREISIRTDSCNKIGKFTREKEGRYKFFVFNEENLLQELARGNKTPERATVDLAFNILEIEPNAHWLVDNYNTIMRGSWPEDHIDWHDDPWKSSRGGLIYKYLRRVEDILGRASLSIAFALKSSKI